MSNNCTNTKFSLKDVMVGDVITLSNKNSFIVVHPRTIGFSDTQHIDTMSDLWEDNLDGMVNIAQKKKAVFDIIGVYRNNIIKYERLGI